MVNIVPPGLCFRGAWGKVEHGLALLRRWLYRIRMQWNHSQARRSTYCFLTFFEKVDMTFSIGLRLQLMQATQLLFHKFAKFLLICVASKRKIGGIETKGQQYRQ
jgi:hypothetical protein